MPPLHSDTEIKATIAKAVAVLSTVIAATAGIVWHAAIQMAQMKQTLASIETFMRNEAVTQTQAERYAAAFKWENRAFGIMVPDPVLYQDKPKG